MCVYVCKGKAIPVQTREAVRAAGGLGYAPAAFTYQEISLVFISVREPQCGGRDYVSEKFQ
jgi:hypothetical protein